MWHVARERPVGKMGGESFSPMWGVDRRQAIEHRTGAALPAEVHDLTSFEESIDRTAEASPEFHLAGNGALHCLGGNAGIQDESVGKFDRLAHLSDRVAECYPGDGRDQVMFCFRSLWLKSGLS